MPGRGCSSPECATGGSSRRDRRAFFFCCFPFFPLFWDRFFDVIMERIEIIDPWKAAIISISKDCATRPLASMYLFSRLQKSMDKMVGHVGAKLRGPKRLAQSHGLTIIYLLVLRRWISDETADYGPTMAELNERLLFADKVVAQLCLSWRRGLNPS